MVELNTVRVTLVPELHDSTIRVRVSFLNMYLEGGSHVSGRD